jgi:hypothetical protein
MQFGRFALLFAGADDHGFREPAHSLWSGPCHGGSLWRRMAPRKQFLKHGIHYVTCDQTKFDLYREVLPLLNSQQVALLEHPRLVAQLYSLERHTGRGGRDSIDHGTQGHDDAVNAAVGALVMATQQAHRVPLRLFMSDDSEIAKQAQHEQILATIRREDVSWPR